MILIPNYSIQRDQKYFPDPEEFKPERFADGEQLSIRQGRGIYLPFGDGPRVCIARRFALLEAKMALAKVVENFQINASSKNIEPLKRNPKEAFIINPIGGLWLKMDKIL
uniref:Cytochrome P450 n=2 Tax=Rhodnius prolixus TaxID=13249 RepID=T1I504_RHOPR